MPHVPGNGLWLFFFLKIQNRKHVCGHQIKHPFFKHEYEARASYHLNFHYLLLLLLYNQQDR